MGDGRALEECSSHANVGDLVLDGILCGLLGVWDVLERLEEESVKG
jgi:hypothetical protein